MHNLREANKVSVSEEDDSVRNMADWFSVVASPESKSPPDRYKSHCTGRCSIPSLEDMVEEAEGNG